MHIGFHGRLVDEPEIRAGFIGCGSHAFRNIYPTFQFAPVSLVATCDLDLARAKAFAAKFGAQAAYADYRAMLAREELDAVFIVVGYDERGRPLYPKIAADCLSAGRHVWMEKPPAATCAEIEAIEQAAEASGKVAMVGLKKMFFPANEKAKELISAPGFGRVQLALLQYPQYVPTQEELMRYFAGEKVSGAVGFLDHLCHPASLMVFLLGMPASLYYERSDNGAGAATFHFASGAVALLAFTHGSSRDGGMERTTLVSDSGSHVVVENNLRIRLHRSPPYETGTGYGSAPNYYTGAPGQATASWEPEFSLGQLYNKGLFLLGYYGEVNEFARAILEGRPPAKGTLRQAWQVTRIFEGFAAGPGKPIPLQERES
ncbi:MAG TPA: Gfo/Idh/MocA family oxidoreductase [Planctomycetota bacterium]|nr:Gfo/Idh/MocA family oxidoreductase [Planctomycetota bacterium]